MTANEIDRGGRPRLFDEDALLDRIRDVDDFMLVEAALVEHSTHPTWAKGCVAWLWRKHAGDSTGGKSPLSATRYRRMLAEIPHDPLSPPGGRRRAIRKLSSQRGSADFLLLTGGAMAGAVALALFSRSGGAHAALLALAPIMPEQLELPFPADSGGSVVPLRPVLAAATGEPLPDARPELERARVEHASRAA